MTYIPLYPIQLKPEFRNYVWGGKRLISLLDPTRSDPNLPLAEVWIVYAENSVINGPLAGLTLAELTARYGSALIGLQAGAAQGQFPLLIKLLDCNDWISVQVHPNDEQARAIEGAGFVGKTEAWHVLEARPGAELVAGTKPGVTQEDVRGAIYGGDVLQHLLKHPIQRGDTIFIRAGTIHALGPGALVYEVQQTSDITYRVYDWDRPLTAGRKLHLEQAAQVTDPSIQVAVAPLPSADGGRATLTASPYFKLETILVSGQPLNLSTRQNSFHALTAIEGTATLHWQAQSFPIGHLGTILVPAECGAYTLTGQGRLLLSALPESNHSTEL